MSFILFVIILAILIFVHELGHFLIAKLFGIRVDEFAIGFPPTLMKKKVGETTYKLNIIPFGGYVSIFGENPDEESLNGPQAKDRSMARKPRLIQAAVLAAGVTFNAVFAWILISLTLIIGISPLASFSPASDHKGEGKIVVSSVIEGSPAERAGLKAGDIIYEARNDSKSLATTPLVVPAVQELIASTKSGDEVTFGLYRNGDGRTLKAVPEVSVTTGKPAIGIAMTSELVRVPWYAAPIEGFKMTLNVIALTGQGLWDFATQAFRGQADLDQVSGPVGIVGMVGNASDSGIAYLLFFTALISVNLAIINILPFPALDGGRLLFILIESITRKSIPAKIANTLNAVGFILLITLMLVITYSDIAKMFTS